MNQSSEKQNAVGLWHETYKLELHAFSQLKDELDLYHQVISLVYECGVEVFTLPSSQKLNDNLRYSSLFLKRCLTDLRTVWSLLTQGYTSQAGTIASSGFENALMVICLATSNERTQKFIREINNEKPSWTVLELCKIACLADSNEKPNKKQLERLWRALYMHYKWLCSIKHPTFESVFHDAFSASVDSKNFAVMAVPDFRSENLPVKNMILNILISRIYSAIGVIAKEHKLIKDNERYDNWKERYTKAHAQLTEIIQEDKKPLPFVINNTRAGDEYLKLLEQENE